jgi:hypothetical protein
VKRVWTALSAVVITCGVVYAGSISVPADENLSGSADPAVIKIEGFCDVQENYELCNNFNLCYGASCVEDFHREHKAVQVKKCLKAGGGQACHTKVFDL